MVPALEAKDGKTVNNPIEANIIAKVFSFHSSFPVINDGTYPLPYGS